MFGIVEANTKALNEQERKKYKAYYCGLCRSLRDRFGKEGPFSLSYDMTFLKLLLSDLYDEKEERIKERCPFHPIRKQMKIRTFSDEYTSNMTIVLTYYSLLDHQRDNDKNKFKKYFKKLERHIPVLREKYPRQFTSIEKNLALLHDAEEKKTDDPVALSSFFGNLLGEVFTPYEDIWKGKLHGLGLSLGRFIYLADARLDLEKDLKKGHFNPFYKMKDNDDFDKTVKEILLDHASDACKALEYLPLEENLSILQNIIYSGIWKQLESENKK